MPGSAPPIYSSFENSSSLKLSAGKAVTALAAYEAAQKLKNSATETWKQRFAYTVTVAEGDLLYNDVHAWLLSILPNDKQRCILVGSDSGSSRVSSDPVPASFSESTTQVKKLRVHFNDQADRRTMIDGHKILVSMQRPEVARNSDVYREPESRKIIFTARTHAGQQAVLKHLERINANRAEERRAVLRMVNSWGSWKTRSDLPPRTLESVTLPLDQKGRIVKDLEEFLAAEDRYNKLAIPWHRGYMFHGPPGTGKTSMVKALASHFNLDLWYISLADLKAESSLLGLLSEVNPRSILLLEDIDTMRITHDRDGADQGMISMSSLLNTLDGVATPHGLITIMTTNRFDILDNALTRAGRMDLIEELQNPSVTEVCWLFEYFYGRWINFPSLEEGKPLKDISAAQISEIFKRHLDNPEAAAQCLYDILIKQISNRSNAFLMNLA